MKTLLFVLLLFGMPSWGFWSEVEVCYSATTFGKAAPLIGDGLDLMAGAMRAKHTWIRTPYKELGMGLRRGTLAWTEWVDHSGFGERKESQCNFIENCDERCVEEALTERKSLGLYSVLNTCQTAVVNVLTRCGCKNTCLKRGDLWPYPCLHWSWPTLGRKIFPKN